jgi:hypothetical protein
MAKKRARKAPIKKAKASRSAKRPVKKTAKRVAKKARRAAPVMDQEAMMAAWQKVMNPGAPHQRLEPIVGSWRVKTTMTMTPNAPPDVSEGVSEHRWVLGGRFVEQVFRGTIGGAPFEGLGYTGYDNATRKYIGTWMDTFGTGLMTSVSVGKPSDTGIDFESDGFDPAGKPMKMWSKARVQDPDHHTYEMWAKGPNGRKFRTMLIEYTRA